MASFLILLADVLRGLVMDDRGSDATPSTNTDAAHQLAKSRFVVDYREQDAGVLSALAAVDYVEVRMN